MKNYGTGKITAMNNGETIAIKVGESYFDITTDGEVKGEIEVKLDTTPGVIDGTGTATDPFVIMSIEDLVWFSRRVNGYKDENNKEISGFSYANQYVELGKTLDFNSDLSYVNPNTTEYDIYLGGDGTKGLKEQLTQGVGFKPIGESTSKCFSGNFDGKNNTIKNIVVKRETSAGFFGNVRSVNISNFTITGNIMSFSGSAGGVVGYVNQATVTFSNVTNYCNVSANKPEGQAYVYVGGIVGNIGGNGGGPYTFLDCENYGEISALSGWHNGAGGIVGKTNNGSGLTIVNTFNKGNVSVLDDAAYTGAGGLVGTPTPFGGMEYVKVYNSFNEGNITGGTSGGLLGQVDSAKLSICNSYNLRSTSNENCGIIGACSSNTEAVLENVFFITNSYVKKEPTNVTKENVRQVTLSELKSKDFIDGLNTFVTQYNASEDKDPTITLKQWIFKGADHPELGT